ncbi:MAG: hypothetical protein COA44_02080 [Arcobacter sp.]|nr:MAG: hypothetical protein COA44_02080 [Arcobacter sp.]
MKKLILSLLLFTKLFADQGTGVESLSPELRALLSQEMLALEKGMHSIFSDIISGNYEEIVITAEQIQNSFILKQKLSPSQRKELQTKLPKAFIHLDQGFHESAGELVNAAEFEDKKLSIEIFTKMTNTCVKCHSTYAKSRFPNF